MTFSIFFKIKEKETESEKQMILSSIPHFHTFTIVSITIKYNILQYFYRNSGIDGIIAIIMTMIMTTCVIFLTFEKAVKGVFKPAAVA